MPIPDNNPQATATANNTALAAGTAKDSRGNAITGFGTPAPTTPAAPPTIYPRTSPTTPTLTPAPIPGAPASSTGTGTPSPSLPVAPTAPGSAASYTNNAENSPGVQAQLDAIKKSFTDQLTTEDSNADQRNKQTNYTNISRGLIGSPDANAAENQTKDSNAKIKQTILDQEQTSIEGVLNNADTLALQQEQIDQTKYTTDYNNWSKQMQDLKTSAQSDFNTLASTAKGTWQDFVTAAPDTAQKIIDQTGYDPNVIPFLFNSIKTKAQQITYDPAPVQMPDGTLAFIGHDPTKSGPDSIVRTPIDTAPQGFATAVVGGLPYWQTLGADGKPDPNGALYPVPSDKGQYITLKDSAGTNYLYNTYTKQTLNPLGADTSGGGVVSPNAPASPITGTSTLANLLGYYVQGNTSYTPGSGYTGAVLSALSGGSLTMTADQLKTQIPALAAGIIKAEGSPGLQKVNNGGAIMWATAKAYGLDTMYGGTPISMKGSDGKMHDYAQFPDSSSGSQALQSYLTSVLSSGDAPKASAQAQSYANDIINGSITNLSSVPKQYRDQVATLLDNTGTTAYPPLAARRFTMAANAIVDNYIKMPAYQLTAGGLPYLGRIAAAMQTPGSISDQDLLDSLTKLNTGGNAISDAQVKLITDGKSFADSVGVAQNKLSTGGVLSSDQRQQISVIANAIFEKYKQEYQPIYDQATKQLTDAVIPKPFWTIPDLTKLSNEGNDPNYTSPGTGSSSTPAGSIINYQGKNYSVDEQGNLIPE